MTTVAITRHRRLGAAALGRTLVRRAGQFTSQVGR